MTYHFTKATDVPFDRVIDVVTKALAEKDFGMLTMIDVKATLKRKLDIEFRPYTILGACNLNFAYQALQHEDKIGTKLPCNVIVQLRDDGKVEVSAADPVASMQSIDNPKLGSVADEVRAPLREAIQSL